MEAKKTSLNEVFLSNRTLKVPYFQRPYVWKAENWEKFYNDIAQIALDAKEGGAPKTYFIGSIILKQAGFDGTQVYEVIDGQQRLTTTVLFMKALFLRIGKNDFFKRQFMQESLLDEDKPILIPGHNDIMTYTQLINQEILTTQELNSSTMAKAYSYFADRIMKSDKGEDEDFPVTAREMYQAVVNSVRLICIYLEENEDAQKIFETINCTGIRLTTGEMLKNYLYDEHHVEDYERTWKKVFEGTNQSYWNDDIVLGRLESNHIKNFFYRYMLIKMQDEEIKKNLTQSEIKSYRKQDGLFEKFKSLIEKCKLTKEAMIEDVISCAKLYMETFKKDVLDEALPKYLGIERLVGLMYASDAWTMTPYILYVLKSQTDGAERKKLFGYMETYLIRRIFCKSSNNNYSDMFSENLIGQHVNTYEGFKSYVTNAKARGSLLIPSDDDVRTAIMSKDQKRNTSVLLYMLESRINDNFEDNDKYTNGYTSFVIEQVMPDKGNEEWVSDSYTAEDCQRLVRTLGNFILLRDKLKAADKKGNWTKKKAAMSTKVDDIKTSAVAARDLASWNEKIIEERNKWFADLAINAWPI